jgi:hypothetical protein
MKQPLQLIITLLLAFSATLHAADAHAPASLTAPEVWLIPPPWPGNGQCLRELVQRGDEWKTARRQVRGIGTYAWLLNVHHSDDDLRALFSRLTEWNLGFGLEVPVVKAKNWGMPEPLQAQSALDQLAGFTARFQSLGMREVAWFAFDEPVYAARYAIPASGAAVPSAPAIELFGRVKMDPDAAHRIAYAAAETASFIAQMRKAHPRARLGDIEPYPALNPDEIETAVNAIQKSCAVHGVKGLDFLRLDVDWDLMEQKTFGSWTEVNQIAARCRARGIAFHMIFWSANQPRLVKATTNPMHWRDGILHQAQAYRAASGNPDALIIESWLHTPEHAVPETNAETFTASVLEFLKAFPAASWIKK